MNRRDALCALIVLGAVPLVSRAQQPAKQARVAYFGFGTPETNIPLREAFKRGMRELGYTDGKTVLIEEHWAMGKAERLPGVAKESWR